MTNRRHFLQTAALSAFAAPLTGQFDGPMDATAAMQIEVEVSAA